MIFEPTPLAGAFTIALERRDDHRGFFARAWPDFDRSLHGVDHFASLS